MDGRHYSRIFSAGDARHAAVPRAPPTSGSTTSRPARAINVTDAEDAAFWTWACIETLRHTGVRNEELLELSQLSIRQYVRPNGEVIALLVIAPSKTDRERVIPMTAELFHVIATHHPPPDPRPADDPAGHPLRQARARHQRTAAVPVPTHHRAAHRGDHPRRRCATMLIRLCDSLAEQHPQLASIRFTPHDFRRLFATDLANNGLPIHIGAALLGHLNLQTFHGYVAVFQEDVIRHYQAHLANRRAARPAGEYRPVTDHEWAEFEEHFDKRKVELGNCGRPYATPCEHEHACIRCPMLRVDPKMLGRLDEIHTDLLARRAHAETQGWLGEIEGIDLTLRFLADKRAETQRLAHVDRDQDTVTVLGMPTIGAPA